MNKTIDLKQNWIPVASLALVLILAGWKLGILKLFYLAFAGVAFVVFFSAILKSNTFAIGLILTLSLTRVVFFVAGLPRAIPMVSAEFCVLLLLAKALYLQLFIYKRSMRVFGFFPMLGIFAVSLISFFVNGSEALPAIFFLRMTFIYYPLSILLLLVYVTCSPTLVLFAHGSPFLGILRCHDYPQVSMMP